MHGLYPSCLTRRALRGLAAFLVLVVAFSTIGVSSARAQDDSPDEVVVFVMDLSGSMNEPFDDDQSKLEVAKAAFVEAFTNVSPDAQVGLRTYGDQIEATSPDGREESCTSDTRLATPVAPLQRDQLIGQVQSFTALGDTPIGLALEAASNDIPSGAVGTIVLFSDGRDECFDADLDGDPLQGPSFGENPCEIAKSITDESSNVARVVTVGFRADAAAETELRCIAESTDGSYTPIQTPEDARDVLPELLVNLSAPREAEMQVGREIKGGTSTDTAPDFVRLDEIDANSVLYTDSIDMNSRRFYHLAEYGPGGGTFTATVFGLPAEAGIELDSWIFVPSLGKDFFFDENADFNAGLPQRPTSSIRCTDCEISGGPFDVFILVELTSQDPALTGTYELELLTEGPAYGGPTTSCVIPQECAYPQEIAQLQAELDVLNSRVAAETSQLAPPNLLADRDALRDQFNEDQAFITSANDRAAALEERVLLAPEASSSWILPLLLIALGAGLAFAPIGKRKRSKDDSEADNEAAEADNEAAESEVATAPVAPRGPSLADVGDAPAVSENRQGAGYDWDAELEAAKEALAQQRPEREADNAPDPELPAYALSPEQLAESLDADAASEVVEEKVSVGQLAAQRAAAQQAALQEDAAAQQGAAVQEDAAAQQGTPEQAGGPPPGWYDDPSQAGQSRWWDGTAWTVHTNDGSAGAPA